MKRILGCMLCAAVMIAMFVLGIAVKGAFDEEYGYSHPNYDMVVKYDKDSKTIFWKGVNSKESPLGTIHLECPCGHHTDKWDRNAVG